MKKKLYIAYLVGRLAFVASGCTSSIGPDGVNVEGMRKFAADHALEACIMVDGHPKLVPLGQQGDAQVLPISNCDPRE